MYVAKAVPPRVSSFGGVSISERDARRDVGRQVRPTNRINHTHSLARIVVCSPWSTKDAPGPLYLREEIAYSHTANTGIRRFSRDVRHPRPRPVRRKKGDRKEGSEEEGATKIMRSRRRGESRLYWRIRLRSPLVLEGK